MNVSVKNINSTKISKEQSTLTLVTFMSRIIQKDKRENLLETHLKNDFKFRSGNAK